MSKQRRLDIFRTLKQIDLKDYQFYSDLSDEEKKAYFPKVIMRWLSGTKNTLQIILINELVNPFIYNLHKHPDLLHKLMCICSSGNKRYYWNKSLSKKSSTTPTIVSVIKDYCGYNTIDAIDALPLLSDEDILQYATELGRQKEDITKIKKELKAR